MISLFWNLILSGMFLLFHFGQCELQVIDVFLQLRALVLQLPLLCSQLCIYFLLILQSLRRLFDFGFKLDFCLNEPLTPFLCITEGFCLLDFIGHSILIIN